MTDLSSLCPVCQRVPGANAPEGLCSKCLWGTLLDSAESEAEDGAPANSIPLASFGHYDLLREVARGGMGVVYQARHVRLQRMVALKMILTTRLPGEAHAKRFRAEAEVIASLEHSHIVPIHEVGEWEGRPYFTMKFVAGGSLADRLKEARASDGGASDAAFGTGRKAAALIAQIARAIHYAHQRGILHRDLKPSNILLDENDAPLVTDFGLARQLEQDSDLTLSGAVLGTPAYAAPEQAAGAKTLSTSADVYSLGAILYELLTGRPPFQADTPLNVLRQVIESDPPRPSALNPRVERDLETICLKCLQKQPAQRYASAEALTDELERWLRHEPIHARPATLAERAGKWARRHPARAALAAVGLLAPAVIIAILLLAAGRVREERNYAVEQEGRAKNAAATAEAAAQEAHAVRAQTRQDLYAADMLLAQHALDNGNLNLARRLVDSYRPGAGRDPALPDLRGFEWRLLWQRCQGDPRETLLTHVDALHSVGFSADGSRFAAGDGRGKVLLWDFPARRLIATLDAANNPVTHLVFTPDARHLAAADSQGEMQIWNLASGKSVWRHKGRNSGSIRFSPSGRWIGVTDGHLGKDPNSATRVVDWASGEDILRVGPSADFEAFSPDGRLIYTTRGGEPRMEIWDAASGKMVKTLPGFNGSMTLSPNGKNFAGSGEAQSIYLGHLEGPRPSRWLRSGWSLGTSLAFSPDSALLANGGIDQVIRLWNMPDETEAGRLLGHLDRVTSVAFSPDGKLLASASLDHTIQLWPLIPPRDEALITNTWPGYAVSPDGSKLAGRTPDAKQQLHLQVWDLATGQPLLPDGIKPSVVKDSFSPDSNSFLARDEFQPDGTLPLWTWDLKSPLSPPQTNLLALRQKTEVFSSAVTPDGAIYAAGQPNLVSFWSLRDGRLLKEQTSSETTYVGSPYLFSPNGQTLLSYALYQGIRMLDLRPGTGFRALDLPSRIQESAFSADGSMFAAACYDHCIYLIDMETLKIASVLRGHQQSVITVAFSPDGKTLASSCRGGAIKLWSLPARREAATLHQSAHDFCFLWFHPDGNSLVAGGWARTQLFKVPSMAEIDAQPQPAPPAQN